MPSLPSSSPAPGFASPDAPAWYAPDLPLLPVDLEIEARLHFEAQALDGRVTTRARATRDGARSLVLDAIGLELHEVTDLDGASLSWRYDGSRLHLTWAEGLARGQERRFAVAWRVQEPLTGLHFGPPQGPPWAATDHETERARYWLPCVDHPSVRPTVTVHLRGPAACSYVSAGQQVGETVHHDGTRTVTWRLEHPCPSYLLCFFAGELVVADGGQHQGKAVRFLAPVPASAEDLGRTFGPTVQMLDWMTARLGVPLPWPRYDQFVAPGIGGAMENISLVSWDDAWLADPRLHAEHGWWIDLVNVHEMAHTWFGDSVGCRDFAHSWLKESWATYIESVWIEEHWGQDAMHAWLHVELRHYVAEAQERYRRPIATRRFDSSWDLFDGHLYPGGAVRLHLLRRTLGEQVFWPAVTDYLTSCAGQVVETDTFRVVMERHAGRSLARFFDQWFHSPGHPRLRVQSTWEAERGRFTLSVEQAQVDLEAGIGPFEVDLVVAVEVQGKDGAPDRWERVILPLSGPRHATSLGLTGRPLQVVVDPDSDLPHELVDFDPGDDMLLRSLSACPHPRGRLRAAEAACRLGRPALLSALAEAFRAEPLFVMRRLYAQSLGESSAPAAGLLLALLLREERDPRVLAPLAAACANHRDPRVARALVDFLADPLRPWIATQAALASLGAQRGAGHLDLLVAALARESRWDRVRLGALAGLGATRHEAALPHIRPHTVEGPLQVRMAAVAALAEAARHAGRGLRQQVAEELCDRLRDPQVKVRLAAARALAALGEASTADAVDALATAVPVQDVPTVRRLAARLRKSDGSVQALEKRVDALTDQVRALRERLEKLEAPAPAAPGPTS